MELSPYLNFNGTCAEAFNVYAQVLGGRIESSQTFGDSPMKDNVPPEWRDKIIHTQLDLGSFKLLGSDAPPPHYAKPQGMGVCYTANDAAQGERIFKALAEGGTVTMPFQKTFWSPGFGMVTDRFGVPWMVNVGA